MSKIEIPQDMLSLDSMLAKGFDVIDDPDPQPYESLSNDPQWTAMSDNCRIAVMFYGSISATIMAAHRQSHFKRPAAWAEEILKWISAV